MKRFPHLQEKSLGFGSPLFGPEQLPFALPGWWAQITNQLNCIRAFLINSTIFRKVENICKNVKTAPRLKVMFAGFRQENPRLLTRHSCLRRFEICQRLESRPRDFIMSASFFAVQIARCYLLSAERPAGALSTISPLLEGGEQPLVQDVFLRLPGAVPVPQ